MNEQRVQTSEALRVGLVLALAGGYLDAYTYLCRGGVFANAETGNMVLLGVKLAAGDWGGAVKYLPPIFAFFLGVLAAEAIGYVKDLGACRVLDLCAGSGCVGLAVAANAPKCRVLLGELSEGAVRICRQNIRRNQLGSQVSVMVLDAMSKPPSAIGEFDCIVCNPPYIPRQDIEKLDISVKNFEPYLALCGGEDGYDFYSFIPQHWRKALRPGGRLYFEVGIGQADTVLRLMRANGFGDINVVQDTGGIPRVVYGTMLESI